MKSKDSALDTKDVEPTYVGPDEIKNALLFARATADDEIKSIERIHKRTLLSFGYIGVFVAAAVAIFGYIGYSNLRDASIATAKAQMQKEVEEQVREKLTTEKINQIVQDQLRDLSAASLHAEIHKELLSDPFASSIRQAADEEAKAQITKQFSPRHLSPAQASLLLQKLTDSKELNGYPIAVTSWTFNVEATNYAGELRKCLSHSPMKLLEMASYDKDPVEGLGIYYDQRQPDTARLLQDALRAAGLDAKLVPGTAQGVIIAPGQKYPLEIFVGSKAME
ncbi:MAG TPA: hypothetical protein VK814_02170 [Acidobacteriaceae bacterium]|nr:hypothetical protein [Acidobacteriaceae bacterium]